MLFSWISFGYQFQEATGGGGVKKQRAGGGEIMKGSIVKIVNYKV